MSDGICLAFVEATGAIAKVAGVTPLPKGITSVETENWKLAVNNGRESIRWAAEDAVLPGYSIMAVHKVYLVVATFDPSGGLILGGDEDRFIEEMREISGASA